MDVSDRTERAPLASESIAEPIAEGDETESVAASALPKCLVNFVARLQSRYREAVTLVELEGTTARAAAEMVGISVSGMKSRVQRGPAQLRYMLEECCEIEVDAAGASRTSRQRPARRGCAVATHRTVPFLVTRTT